MTILPPDIAAIGEYEVTITVLDDDSVRSGTRQEAEGEFKIIVTDFPPEPEPIEFEVNQKKKYKEIPGTVPPVVKIAEITKYGKVKVTFS